MAYDIHLAPGAEARAVTLLRCPVDWELLAAACGALDGSRVEFSLYRDWLWAEARHPDILEQQCTLRRDSNGRLYIYIHEFTKRASARKGIGGDSVELQVKAAEALGCEYLEMWAAGDATSASRNGYYTWAVLGFDGPLTLREQGRLPQELRSARTIGEVILRGGAQWWKIVGYERKLVFNLAEGSLSRKILTEYRRRKRGNYGYFNRQPDS